MEQVHAIAVELHRADKDLRRATLDPRNGIPHELRRDGGRPTLFADRAALLAWHKANPPRVTPRQKTVGAWVMRENDDTRVAEILQVDAETNKAKVEFVPGAPVWVHRNRLRLVNGGDK